MHRKTCVGVMASTLCCGAIFAAQQTGAQPTVKPSIHGTVMEDGASPLPVADASIVLSRLPAGGQRVVSSAIPKDNIAVTKTDYSGAFSFDIDKLGDYSVEVYKEGYSTAESSRSELTVSLTKDHPTGEVKFLVVRAGEVEGRVLDAETKKPIPRFRVGIDRRTYHQGRAFPQPVGQATTDADGHFVLAKVQPGDYIAFPLPSQPKLLTQFSEEDFKAADSGYISGWWPGDTADPGSAFPVTLFSGARRISATFSCGSCRCTMRALPSCPRPALQAKSFSCNWPPGTVHRGSADTVRTCLAASNT